MMEEKTMKKQNPNKEISWEFQHEGLRVRVIASIGISKIDIEVFDDKIAVDTIFNQDFQIGYIYPPYNNQNIISKKYKREKL